MGENCSPGVLDYPVVSCRVFAIKGLCMLRAVADNQDPMVQGCATGGCEDTASIQLELPLISLNGN